MKEIQGKSILVRVIGSRLSLEDFALVLKIRHLGKLHFAFFTRKVLWLFILKGVKPSLDRKVITFLTFDNLFPPLGHSC